MKLETTLTRETVDRNSAIKFIREALKKRSGKAWSVKGGTGTAWGWIEIDAPPARQTWLRTEAQISDGQKLVVWYNSKKTGGYTSPAEQKELSLLLGGARVSSQGVSIPASSNYYMEFIDRARGATPRVIGKPYWD